MAFQPSMFLYGQRATVADSYWRANCSRALLQAAAAAAAVASSPASSSPSASPIDLNQQQQQDFRTELISRHKEQQRLQHGNSIGSNTMSSEFGDEEDEERVEYLEEEEEEEEGEGAKEAEQDAEAEAESLVQREMEAEDEQEQALNLSLNNKARATTSDEDNLLLAANDHRQQDVRCALAATGRSLLSQDQLHQQAQQLLAQQHQLQPNNDNQRLYQHLSSALGAMATNSDNKHSSSSSSFSSSTSSASSTCSSYAYDSSASYSPERHHQHQLQQTLSRLQSNQQNQAHLNQQQQQRLIFPAQAEQQHLQSLQQHLHAHSAAVRRAADSDDLDRIRNFIEEFKQRRGALGLTQKQAAQCFRAYTNDRYAFSDNFVGHFEGFQFRPQTAMTIADSLAEWLEFAENETRQGRQLSFMPGKVKETRKRKYEVIRIRDSAKKVLVEAFEKNRSPSTSELEQLSRKTNIPSRNIEIFFKNRRTSRQYHH